MWLFALFVAVPIVEIALFIQVGGWLGLWPTLLIVILTAMLGTVLVRRQGLAAIREVQGSLTELRDPTRPLAHGAMILASGLLLLTPGFFTDAVGFALLVPAVRDAAMAFVARRVTAARFTVGPDGRPTPADPRIDPRRAAPPQRPARGEVLEGDWEEVPHDPDAPPSGWTRRD
ncbi:FxsA family protein [Jannaschia sp. W003]|uniref:FxsA family protein n=1 Tax=Jannaschia sp. W003 TaxID=2867012 RepID=UPI0021A7137B|nr:FxsA family protein [Jannaschia sp. W003]UWQ21983.1 FxsA family protein [Jannaschia sp. W003]